MRFGYLIALHVAAGLAAGMAMTGGPAPAIAKTEKEIRQCKALNKCRAEFTRCYYAIEKDPRKTWETHEWECAKPYKDCIDSNFGAFDMFFTRMFDPRVQDCGR